jgi:hypothetical protein
MKKQELVKEISYPTYTEPGVATKKSCNRHDDCEAAKDKAITEGRNPYNICCHDDCCEDCFGC